MSPAAATAARPGPGGNPVFRFNVFTEFLTWVAFYIIFKACVHFINIEARRNQRSTIAGVSGLLA